MNEKLQFSWGHIIAFLALIAISYISFVGFTYLTNGNFTYALIGMGVTDLLFIIFFIGAQQMKASGEKMNRKIVFERIFIFGSPIIFIGGMIAMSHFWTVHSKNDEIVHTFSESINSSKKLFDDYETYSNGRIEAYEKSLNQIIANKSSNIKAFKDAGFEDDKANIQKENMVETLRLQLLSQNYDSLKTVAVKWIDDASHGASTWNVFLLGNTREIVSALNSWENQLKSFSARGMSNEALVNEVPKFSSNEAQKAVIGIEGLTATYTTQKFPTLTAIVFGIIVYLMLMFPYFIQERHTKSVLRLIGNENSKHNKTHKSKRKQTNTNDENEDELELNLEEDNDYPSF